MDINLHDTSVKRAEESIDHLEKLFSAQTCPLNLRLTFPNGSGEMLIKTFQSRLESFKRLELVKWNFNGCDWEWLKRCPNLIEFAITNPPQTQVSKILGTNYEIFRLKPSKNSKILTAHWHFNKNDEISSKFYFHPDKPSTESYDVKPPVVIQPRVSRRTNDPKKLQYIRESIMRRMFKDLYHDSSDDDSFYYSTSNYDYDYDDGYDESCGMSYEQWWDTIDPN